MRKLTEFKGYIAKGTIIGMLALSFGTGSAWADDAGSESAASDVTVTADAAEAAQAQETPSLLPGDFFYFIKSIYERIQLAFASDDMDEAILLAQFAQERLAESAALLQQGDAEIADETLQRSLTVQQQAIDTAETVVKPVVTETDAGTAEQTTTTGVEVKEEDKGTEALEVAADDADDSSVSANNTADEEQSEEEDDAELDVKPEQADKVKKALQHNIVALTAALEKVKNPQAQRSLLKNITKSFAHLEKKLMKISAKSNAVITVTTDITAPEVSSDAAATDSQSTVTSQATVTSQSTVTAKVNAVIEPSTQSQSQPAVQKAEVEHSSSTKVKAHEDEDEDKDQDEDKDEIKNNNKKEDEQSGHEAKQKQMKEKKLAQAAKKQQHNAEKSHKKADKQVSDDQGEDEQ